MKGRGLTDVVFGGLVLAASAVALSPVVAQIEQARQPAVTMASGLAYQGQAVTFNGPRSEALGQDALELIGYPWGVHLQGWRIEFVDGDGDVAGYTWSHEARIEVFVRPNDDALTIARVLAHELGHAVDVSLNSSSERRGWLEQRGAESTTWWPTSGAADFETGAGDFAEVFAAWQVGDRDFRSRVAGEPTPEDLELLRSLAEK